MASKEGKVPKEGSTGEKEKGRWGGEKSILEDVE